MATNIVVPELGESVIEATVARWLKQPGEAVKAGEAVLVLETDKVDLEVAAEKSGVLASVAQAEGADVKVGDVLGVIDETGTASALLPKQEEKPALLVTIDIPGDEREVPGLCWTHRLRLLGQPADPGQGQGPGTR